MFVVWVIHMKTTRPAEHRIIPLRASGLVIKRTKTNGVSSGASWTASILPVQIHGFFYLTTRRYLCTAGFQCNGSSWLVAWPSDRSLDAFILTITALDTSHQWFTAFRNLCRKIQVCPLTILRFSIARKHRRGTITCQYLLKIVCA